jgi:ribosomal protein S18 acetylase RimI-like enzyme
LIEFRDIEDRDVEAIVALWRACGLTRAWNDPYKDISFARQGKESTVLVGGIEGRLVAFAMVGHDGHRGTLYYLAVDPALQGQGLGRVTVCAAENWLGARGV